jgi:hypothetical protein
LPLIKPCLPSPETTLLSLQYSPTQAVSESSLVFCTLSSTQASLKIGFVPTTHFKLFQATLRHVQHSSMVWGAVIIPPHLIASDPSRMLQKGHYFLHVRDAWTLMGQ